MATEPFAIGVPATERVAFARFVRHRGALRPSPPPGRMCFCPWHATWGATEAIMVQEMLRGVFYAPFRAAMARSAFADGVETRFTSRSAPGAGSADGWRRGRRLGGSVRVNHGELTRPSAEFVCFVEAITHDPFFLADVRFFQPASPKRTGPFR